MQHSDRTRLRSALVLCVIVLSALLATACTSPGAIPFSHSENLRGENFREYERFAWLEGASEAQRETQPAEHKLHEMIRGALQAELDRRGYVLDATGQPDFLVTFHCRTRDELSATVIDREWYDVGDNSEVEWVTPRRELSLTPDAPPAELDRIVRSSVRSILAEFPPPG